MNNFICTCCNYMFDSNANLKRHRKMKLLHAINKYSQYFEDMNKKNNICNCGCCKANFPPTNINNQQHIECQLRIILSNDLDPLWALDNTIRNKGNDIYTDLIYMRYDFETNQNIADLFINHVNHINFNYTGFRGTFLQ
jgi:hypothetical protein